MRFSTCALSVLVPTVSLLIEGATANYDEPHGSLLRGLKDLFQPAGNLRLSKTQIDICKVPLGDPMDFHTIKVPEHAATKHFATGSFAGACSAMCDTLCSDDDACTTDYRDDCEQFGCLPLEGGRPPVVCDSGDICMEFLTCDSTEGCMYTDVICNDNNACTTDTCDTNKGCVYTDVICNDNNPCTIDSCVPAMGGCEHEWITTGDDCNLIENGSFETNTVNGDLETFSVGSSFIAPWQITSNDIDVILSYWQASDGSQSLDMNGLNSDGTIEQTVATEIGASYEVFFDLAGNPDESSMKHLTVLVNGVNSGVFQFDQSGTSATSMNWTLKTFSFTATSQSTVLEFKGDPNPNIKFWGPALDNVRMYRTA